MIVCNITDAGLRELHPIELSQVYQMEPSHTSAIEPEQRQKQNQRQVACCKKLKTRVSVSVCCC